MRHIPRGKRTRSPSTSAPRFAEEPEGIRIASKDQPDLLEDRVGVVLEDRQAFVVEDLERRELAGQERRLSRHGRGAGPPGDRLDRPIGAGGCRPSSVLLRGRGQGLRRRRWAARRIGRRRRSPIGRPAASTTRARCSKLAVLCGNASASTKCSWKRGSTAVSIFSTLRTTPSISVRAAPDRSAISAPVPAALPADRTLAEVAVRDQPEDHRVGRVDLAAERAGQPDVVDRLDSGVIHEQPDPGVERGLGELDRPDVVLGDDDPRLPVVEDVRERPPIRARSAPSVRPGRRRRSRRP